MSETKVLAHTLSLGTQIYVDVDCPNATVIGIETVKTSSENHHMLRIRWETYYRDYVDKRGNMLVPSTKLVCLAYKGPEIRAHDLTIGAKIKLRDGDVATVTNIEYRSKEKYHFNIGFEWQTGDTSGFCVCKPGRKLQLVCAL